MEQAIYETARNESPADRIKHLKEELFKPGGPVVPPSPAAPAPTASETVTEFGRRGKKITGKLPPHFPPARRVINTPEHQARFEKFILEGSEGEPAPASPAEVTRPPAPSEKPLNPVPVPVPDSIPTPNESEDDMKKKATAKPAPSQALKGSRGIPASPASAKTFDNLFELHKKGEAPTYSEYQAKFGKIDRNVFYSARQKLDRVTKAKQGPAGRGKPAQVFSPAPAAGGNGARIEILYTSDTSPKADIMEELKKILPQVLAAFSASAGIPIDVSELEIKNFAPAGYEIRRKVR